MVQLLVLVIYGRNVRARQRSHIVIPLFGIIEMRLRFATQLVGARDAVARIIAA